MSNVKNHENWATIRDRVGGFEWFDHNFGYAKCRFKLARALSLKAVSSAADE